MLKQNDFELLQRHQDGDLSPAEVQRVETLLAVSPEARMAAAVLQSLDRHTDDGQGSETAVPEIMARVQAMPHPRPLGWTALVRNRAARAINETLNAFAGPQTRVEETMASRSKIVWGISGTALVILAGLWMAGLIPPKQEGADATIGAAKRYQAPQIAASDVKLGDTEAQAFMQSETFDRILKDPNTRKLLASAEMRQMLSSPELDSASTPTG